MSMSSSGRSIWISFWMGVYEGTGVYPKHREDVSERRAVQGVRVHREEDILDQEVSGDRGKGEKSVNDRHRQLLDPPSEVAADCTDEGSQDGG